MVVVNINTNRTRTQVQNTNNTIHKTLGVTITNVIKHRAVHKQHIVVFSSNHIKKQIRALHVLEIGKRRRTVDFWHLISPINLNIDSYSKNSSLGCAFQNNCRCTLLVFSLATFNLTIWLLKVHTWLCLHNSRINQVLARYYNRFIIFFL